MSSLNSSRAYLVGAGIGSLAAAVFLIRDGHLAGENIHILEELPLAGGALDGSGNPVKGYVTRGGRMLEEEVYVCLWNLLANIPSLDDPTVSVKDEIWAFNAAHPSNAKARLIGSNQTILDAAELGFNTIDRIEIARLLASPEHVLGGRSIDDLFSAHFFQTNFWFLWRTTFAFQNWHSAIELKRYFIRFAQELPRISTLAGVRRTPLNQYDSLVRPIQAWLAARGVIIEHGVRVTDVDFTVVDGARRAERIHFRRDGHDDSYSLGPDDYAFITLGSMTSDASYGDDDHAPELIRTKRDGSWTLWETLAAKAQDFGSPNTFDDNIDKSKWESFTLTMRSPLLLQRIEELSDNVPGEGGLMTFTDSAWLMSIVVPHQPHFAAQPENVSTLWGYGLFLDKPGDFVAATLANATGQQILTELAGHLGTNDILDELRLTTTVIPVMMPYITSEFARRAIGDRPIPVPKGSENFAFLGQFTEISGGVEFTVENSVRGAMLGVYELLNIAVEIPPIYHGLRDPKIAIQVLKSLG